MATATANPSTEPQAAAEAAISDSELTLEAIRATSFPHSGGRSLGDHLHGTFDVLRRWNMPRYVAVAGLFHSVYSTESYRYAALSYDKRPLLETMIGRESERLAYLFSISSLKALTVAAAALPHGPVTGTLVIKASSPQSGAEQTEQLSPQLFWDLLRLHAANLAEQTQAQDGWPGVWLSRLSDLEYTAQQHGQTLCPVMSCEGGAGRQRPIELHDERNARDLYRQAFHQSGETQASSFGACSALLPQLAEPFFWRGYSLLCAGRKAEAIRSFERARTQLKTMGVTWDKRMIFSELSELTEVLLSAGEGDSRVSDAMERLAGYAASWLGTPSASLPTATTEYFARVLAEGASAVGWYPGLRSQPWHNAADFLLIRRLEEVFPQLRREVSALETEGFHEEAENIARSGSWKVYMLFEGGLKQKENCARVPTLEAILESDPAVRRGSGLIYISRLAPHTKIAAHRGPTNMRVRAHFPFTVPEGGCKMRVGGETRGWVEGKGIVFDDYYEHEVWNNTGEDRLVLVADLWHPDLSEAEIQLLTAVDWMVTKQATSKARYWARNEKQKRSEQRAPLPH